MEKYITHCATLRCGIISHEWLQTSTLKAIFPPLCDLAAVMVKAFAFVCEDKLRLGLPPPETNVQDWP